MCSSRVGLTTYSFCLRAERLPNFGAGLGHLSPFLVLWAISETISPFWGMLWAKLLVWVKWQSLFFVPVQPCAQGHDSKTITEQKEKGWIICRPVIIMHSLQYSISEPSLCGSTQHQDLLENGMRPDLPPTATSYYYACHVNSMHAMHHNTFNVNN